MNEEDLKTRTYWVKFLWSMTAFNMITNAFFQLRYDFSMGTLPSAFRYGQFAVTSILTLFFAYLLYRCAYKKTGTKFLSFCLVATLFNLVFLPALYFLGKVPFADQIPYYREFLFFGEVLSIAWFILCWKLRKLNKKLQVQNS